MGAPSIQCNSVKVNVFNLSSQHISDGEISLFQLGTKFVPVTKSSTLETKVDILKFSRKLLLKARFHDSDFNDDSLVRPTSRFTPKSTTSLVLKKVVEDLEICANRVPGNLTRVDRDDNLTPDCGIDSPTQDRHQYENLV